MAAAGLTAGGLLVLAMIVVSVRGWFTLPSDARVPVHHGLRGYGQYLSEDRRAGDLASGGDRHLRPVHRRLRRGPGHALPGDGSAAPFPARRARHPLAETGDPRRYDSSSSLVKHAGLSPSGNASGAFEGQAHISRRGRPGLRLTVWRAIWPLLIHNSVMAAKYAAMIAAADAAAAQAAQAESGTKSRQSSAAAAARARRAKARVACAASLLRWIYSIVVHDTGWDPDVASGAASCQHAPRRQAEAA